MSEHLTNKQESQPSAMVIQTAPLHEEYVQPADRPLLRGPNNGWWRRLISLFVILAGIGIWECLTAWHVFQPLYLPSPLMVIQNGQTLVTVGFSGQTLFASIWISTLRIAGGFLLAVLIGVPIGLLMARNEVIYQIIDPFLQFIRPVPPLAYIPLLVLWFGIGEIPKVLLILLGTVPVIIISTISGVRGTPVQRIRVAQSLGATRLQLFRYAILPSALPEIFTGMRVGIGVAWTCLVAAELTGADAGLGWLVQIAGQDLQVGMVFVGIIAIGILGYLMEFLIRGIERLVVPWKGHE